MKAIPSILGLIMVVLSLSACSGLRDNDMRSESQWNHLGIWRRVPGTPDSYVPSEYASGRSTNDSKGRWFVDRKDGKRLFVPHGGVDHWNEEALLGEARKITHVPPDQKADHLADDVKEGAFGVMMAFAQALGQMGR